MWGAKPHDLAAIAAWHLGMTAAAVEHGAEAARLEPDNDRLRGNLAHYWEGLR